MIYITKRYDSLLERSSTNNVWEVNCEGVEQLYKEFIINKAAELNITINPHWLNIMNYKDHNSHLTEEEYKKLSKKWDKVLRQWNIDKFIGDILKGQKLKFKELYR